jgi:transcriptional regulator with XRE-family HTH domain
MTTDERSAELPDVNGQWIRGQEIKRRRLAVGIKSLREFAEATGVSRNAITAAEDGHGSKATYERLEAWLDGFDVETGNDEPPLEHIEFLIEGKGVRVTVRGPVADREALKRDVADIVRTIRDDEASDPPKS